MNLWCVGRNYREHANELGNQIPDKPLIFLKAGSCLTESRHIILPDWAGDIHHECELAVQVDGEGRLKALALALDLTARSLQNELKKKGEPWTLAKSFTGACPMSPSVPFPGMEQFSALVFHFYKNEEITQHGKAADMIFPLPILLSYVLKHFPVKNGDWLLTGTPAGVGPLRRGDRLLADIPGMLSVTWDVN